MPTKFRIVSSCLLIGITGAGACHGDTAHDTFTASTTADSGGPEDGDGSPGLDHEVIVRVPVAEDGVLYEGDGQEEALPWGPTAFAVGEDGTLWLADGVRGRVLEYDSRSGTRLATHLLGDELERILGLVVTDEALFILDAGPRARIVRVDRGDQRVTATTLPDALQIERGVTGLIVADDGAVLLELNGGSSRYQVVDPEGRFAVTERADLEIDGHVVRARPGELTGDAPGEGAIEVDGIDVATISLPAGLVGLRVLGTWGDGSFAVSVQELALVDGVVRVDETVRKYSLTGAFLGEARLDTASDYLHMGQPLSLGAHGEVYHAAPRAAYVELRRLTFSTTPLDRLLPASPLTIAPHGGLDQGGGTGPWTPITLDDCVSADEMLATAKAYAEHTQSYTQTNISGACAGRKTPDWLKTAGKEYTGVAYDWGGMSTIDGYVQALAQGRQAGDMNTSGSETCSVGVDCSGFMMNVWEIEPPKLNTAKFASDKARFANVTSLDKLVIGDAFVVGGSHIMMFAGYDGDTNVPVFAESEGEHDRVVRMPRSWPYVDGYQAIRYEKHCVNTCVDGSFSADPMIAGGHLQASGSVEAPKGLLRYSLVIDAIQPPAWTEDYPPQVLADSFAADIDLAGYSPGAHTLGLWVKDVNECVKLVATRDFVIDGGGDSVVCGDGVIEGGELCDGAALGGATCQGLGWSGGSLGCSPACTYDTSGCTKGGMDECGNGLKEPGEACDGADLGGQSCVGLGWKGGSLACSPTCTFDTGSCTNNGQVECGNGVKDPGESCDGADLGGQSCQSLGHSGGVLGCSGACGYDTSECYDDPMCTYEVSPKAPASSQSAPYTCTGGVVMPISGSIDENTGKLTVSSPGKQGGYGPGTYRVVVFDPNDAVSDQCKSYNVEKTKVVLNATANSITFPAFDSLLMCGGDAKAYCIAKDDGGQKAFWCSGKLVASYQ